MLELKCFSYSTVIVLIFILLYIGITIWICSLVAMLTEDLLLTLILIFIFLVFMFTILKVIMMFESNKRSSTGNSAAPEIFTISTYQEPPPSYDSLFEMNTLPPPYEIATKKNMKESEVSQTIICVE